MSIALGLLMMIVFGLFLSFTWSLSAAAFQLPISVPNNSALVITIASVVAGAGYAARREGRWWKGLFVGVAAVLIYWGAWIFVSSRFRLPEAWSFGIMGVGGQLWWWILALAIGFVAAMIGAEFRLRPPRIGTELPSSVPLLFWSWALGMVACAGLALIAQRTEGNYVFASLGNTPSSIVRYFRHVESKGVSDVPGAKRLRAISKWDGTQFDLFVFDMSHVHAGIYDNDRHDAKPGDNRNYCYYGYNAMRSVRRIQRAAAKSGGVIAVFNGAPFDCDAATVWSASRSKASSKAWYECGTRDIPSLMSGGRRASVSNTLPESLKTSRTSMAWDGRRRLYVLIVHDPDGEADSRRQLASGKVQTGGWDAKQVREFWAMMGLSGVSLSGGDSSQIVYKWRRSSPGPFRDSGRGFIASRGLSVTAGYINNRPVSLAIPTLPSYLMSRGSLDYVYLYKK